MLVWDIHHGLTSSLDSAEGLVLVGENESVSVGGGVDGDGKVTRGEFELLIAGFGEGGFGL